MMRWERYNRQGKMDRKIENSTERKGRRVDERREHMQITREPKRKNSI